MDVYFSAMCKLGISAHARWLFSATWERDNKWWGVSFTASGLFLPVFIPSISIHEVKSQSRDFHYDHSLCVPKTVPSPFAVAMFIDAQARPYAFGTTYLFVPPNAKYRPRPIWQAPGRRNEIIT
jgi:hypothetical protein